MTKGLLDFEQLDRCVSEGEIDTVVVAFPDLYGRLMGKRFAGSFFLDAVANHGTHGCDYLLTVDMDMQPVPGYLFANWDKGYGDLHLVPDLTTLRHASWLDRTALVLCDVKDDSTDALIRQAPRSLLREQVARAADMGFIAEAGSELEYYVFKDGFCEARDRAYQKLIPASQYIEDYHILQGRQEAMLNAAARRHLCSSGVPVESTKGEWGLGQHELNLRHTQVLEMADRHTVLKQCLKELAASHDLSLTFMAKYSEEAAGSSCHVHVSLWGNERNLFAGPLAFGQLRCSDHFRWFLGGWIAHAAELMAFYAPNVNSYKRYRAGSWAPTRLAWAHDNRTAGFRVVGRDQSLRIECRIPGADCNPYLVYAAALASGLDGIAQRLEPPAMFEGNAYAADEVPHVPRTLREAVDLLRHSEFAKAAFGSDVVEHYAHFFRTEQEAYDRAVTDWERQRYFERI